MFCKIDVRKIKYRKDSDAEVYTRVLYVSTGTYRTEPKIIHVELGLLNKAIEVCCCCLPTPMTLASGGSPMFPLVVHQPASPSIWSAVQPLRRGLSANPGVTMWCVGGCS